MIMPHDVVNVINRFPAPLLRNWQAGTWGTTPQEKHVTQQFALALAAAGQPPGTIWTARQTHALLPNGMTQRGSWNGTIARGSFIDLAWANAFAAPSPDVLCEVKCRGSGAQSLVHWLFLSDVLSLGIALTNMNAARAQAILVLPVGEMARTRWFACLVPPAGQRMTLNLTPSLCRAGNPRQPTHVTGVNIQLQCWGAAGTVMSGTTRAKYYSFWQKLGSLLVQYDAQTVQANGYTVLLCEVYPAVLRGAHVQMADWLP